VRTGILALVRAAGPGHPEASDPSLGAE
jgi:hypothetical protein